MDRVVRALHIHDPALTAPLIAACGRLTPSAAQTAST